MPRTTHPCSFINPKDGIACTNTGYKSCSRCDMAAEQHLKPSLKHYYCSQCFEKREWCRRQLPGLSNDDEDPEPDGSIEGFVTFFNQCRDDNPESDEEFSILEPTSKRLRGRKKKRSQSKTSSGSLNKNVTTRSRSDSSDHGELDVASTHELEVSDHELSLSVDNTLLEPQDVAILTSCGDQVSGNHEQDNSFTQRNCFSASDTAVQTNPIIVNLAQDGESGVILLDVDADVAKNNKDARGSELVDLTANDPAAKKMPIIVNLTHDDSADMPTRAQAALIINPTADAETSVNDSRRHSDCESHCGIDSDDEDAPEFDVDVNCSDENRLISSILPEEFNTGFNLAVYTSGGCDLTCRTGSIFTKNAKKSTASIVFVQALLTNTNKYAENIVTLYVDSKEFQNWRGSGILRARSSFPFSWNSLASSPNPQMFWRKIGNVIAFDNSFCEDSLSQEFVTSVATYLKATLAANTGTLDDLLAFEDSLKYKRGSEWLPPDVDEISTVETLAELADERADPAIAGNISEHSVGMPQIVEGNAEVDTAVEANTSEPIAVTNKKRAKSSEPTISRPRLTRKRNAPDKLVPGDGGSSTKQSGKSKKKASSVGDKDYIEIEPVSMPVAKKKRTYKRKDKIYADDATMQNDSGFEPLSSEVGDTYISPFSFTSSQAPTTIPTGIPQKSTSNSSTTIPTGIPQKSTSNSSNGNVPNESVPARLSDDQCFDFVEKQVTRAHKLAMMSIKYKSKEASTKRRGKKKAKVEELKLKTKVTAHARKELLFDMENKAQASHIYNMYQTNQTPVMYKPMGMPFTPNWIPIPSGKKSKKKTSDGTPTMASSSMAPMFIHGPTTPQYYPQVPIPPQYYPHPTDPRSMMAQQYHTSVTSAKKGKKSKSKNNLEIAEAKTDKSARRNAEDVSDDCGSGSDDGSVEESDEDSDGGSDENSSEESDEESDESSSVE